MNYNIYNIYIVSSPLYEHNLRKEVLQFTIFSKQIIYSVTCHLVFVVKRYCKNVVYKAFHIK